LHFGPTVRIKRLQRLSQLAARQVWLSEVCRQIVPDSGSSCTESFVTKVGLCPTDEKCAGFKPSEVYMEGKGQW